MRRVAERVKIMSWMLTIGSHCRGILLCLRLQSQTSCLGQRVACKKTSFSLLVNDRECVIASIFFSFFMAKINPKIYQFR